MYIRHALAFALLASTLPVMAEPPATPAPRQEPPLVSAYERKVLAKEMKTLSDAAETLLYKQDGLPEKIKRLLDVGNLLRYDTPNQREKRRQNRTVVHANPFPAASTNAPAAPVVQAPASPGERAD